MFIDEQVKSEYVDVVSNVSSSVVKTVDSVDVKNKGVYSTVETKPVKKNSFSSLIIEDWISDDESEVEFEPKVEDKTVRPSIKKIKFVKPASEKVEKTKRATYSRKSKRKKELLTVVALDGKGRISRKGKIKTGTLDFDDVYFYKELKYNLFSVSQMCDKKNNVLFTDTECLVLSFNFKLLDESQVLLRVPRKDNIYNVDLKSVVPTGGLTCLFAKATTDESNLWHRRLGHINYKTMNKLVKGNLDETSGILKTFITGIENQLDCKVKVVRCENGTEFKNSVMNQFCDMKGIKREFSVARTPQQNGVAERKNRSLIEVARTMALVIKPHNKTPYEFIRGRSPLIDFMKPFGFVAGFQTNGIAGTKDNIVAGQAKNKKEPEQEYNLIPICTTDPLISQGPKDSAVDAGKKATEVDESQVSDNDGQDDQVTRISSPVNTAGPSFVNAVSPSPINAARTPASTNTLVDLPKDKWAIGTKWVFRNKKDEKGIVIKSKARLVTQGHTQEEFYQMDVKSAFLYGKIEEDVYVYQPPRFEDPYFPDKVYKAEKALYGLHEAPRASQDKYVADIFKKFDFSTVKTASTPMEPNKALIKDAEAEDLDVHLYRSMIGSLMYITTSRPDITFVVCACARFQVTPKTSHLHAVKRIFIYLN
nr:ribonuclease H-like domain-containing protein [Tanacetum cinerariifolium]